MMQEAKISIIIPVYNGASFIEETIHHIQKSTHKNLELILVNDGSSDNSADIIEKMREEDDRIFLYSKENGGIVSARNYGVQKATGDFICFCDHDDVVMDDMYRLLCEKMQADGSDVGMCTSGRFLDGKKTLLDIYEENIYIGKQIEQHLLLPLLFNGYDVAIDMEEVNRYPGIWNCMFRTSFWRTYNFQFRAYVNFEDDMLLKVDVLSKATKISTIAYAGYYWRTNLKSESYAHKYVEDIGKKQQQVLEDVKNSVQCRIEDAQVIDLLERVVLCKQYVDAVHNITSPYCKKTWSSIHKYYEKNIYSRNFSEAVTARKMVKKGRIKPKLLLPLLAHKMTIFSFIAELILNRVLLITLRSQTLTKLERLMKR